MSYILPRAVIVLVGWAVTCGIIHNVSIHVSATAFYIAAVSWGLAGIACFGYLYRLRSALQEHRGRS